MCVPLYLTFFIRTGGLRALPRLVNLAHELVGRVSQRLRAQDPYHVGRVTAHAAALERAHDSHRYTRRNLVALDSVHVQDARRVLDAHAVAEQAAEHGKQEVVGLDAKFCEALRHAGKLLGQGGKRGVVCGVHSGLIADEERERESAVEHVREGNKGICRGHVEQEKGSHVMDSNSRVNVRAVRAVGDADVHKFLVERLFGRVLRFGGEHFKLGKNALRVLDDLRVATVEGGFAQLSDLQLSLFQRDFVRDFGHFELVTDGLLPDLSAELGRDTVPPHLSVGALELGIRHFLVPVGEQQTRPVFCFDAFGLLASDGFVFLALGFEAF